MSRWFNTHPPIRLVFVWCAVVNFLDLEATAFWSKTPEVTRCRVEESYSTSNVRCSIRPTLTNQTFTHQVMDELRREKACGRKKNVSLTFSCGKLLNVSMPTNRTLNFTELSSCLPSLYLFSAPFCGFATKDLRGKFPPSLRYLNLSNNHLESLSSELFQSEPKPQLSNVDISNNRNLKGFPEAFLNMTSIYSLWLGEHNITCAWIASHLFKWYRNNPNIFKDADRNDCKTAESEKSVRLTVLGALMAKKVETDECKKVTSSCSCLIRTVHNTRNIGRNRGTVPSSFKSYGDDIYITLKVDCSKRNLTALPTLSPLVRFLNASYNRITTLEPLLQSSYKNLGELDVEYNEIESIEGIEKTEFVKHFDVLGLSHNRIQELQLPAARALLEAVGGHGRISLGENPIHCDCDTYQYIKPLLTKNRVKVDAKDAKKITCANLRIKVQELEAIHVCKWGDESNPNAIWYWVSGIEVALIFIVILKVWYDKRQYRERGVLPWCSQQIPRLPCEFILESSSWHVADV